MRRWSMLPVMASGLWLGVVLLAGRSPAAEPSGTGDTNWRRYGDGPLSAQDFRSPIPPPNDPERRQGNLSLTAFTRTELRYELRIQSSGSGSRWVARYTKADVYAIVLRDRSWILTPQDARLMDHEQGHFDITQGLALAVQLRLADQLRSRRPIVGSGNTPIAAKSDLEERVRRELVSLMDELPIAHQEYDRITGNGTIPLAQADQRQQQLARIAEFRAKLDGKKAKSGKPTAEAK